MKENTIVGYYCEDLKIISCMMLGKMCKLYQNLMHSELLSCKSYLDKYYYQEIIFILSFLEKKIHICKPTVMSFILSNSLIQCFRFWLLTHMGCQPSRFPWYRAVRWFQANPLPDPTYHASVQSEECPWYMQSRLLSEETEPELLLQIPICM